MKISKFLNVNIMIIKRHMFTKPGNSMVLKKSGEIIINTKLKSDNDNIILGPISQPVLLCIGDSGKRFYTIPLLCIDTVSKSEFKNIYGIQKKGDFIDNYLTIKKILINELTAFYSDDPLATITKDLTWARFNESDESDEAAVALIEEKIKDWIIEYLKERREEWTFLLNKESIEARNWRLLKEAESFLLNK